jgi:hypothetical protein
VPNVVQLGVQFLPTIHNKQGGEVGHRRSISL